MAEHGDGSPHSQVDSQAVSQGLLPVALGATVFCSLVAVIGLLLLIKDLLMIIYGIVLGSVVGTSLARAFNRSELWGMPYKPSVPSQTGRASLTRGFARGTAIAILFCLFGGIPLAVVASICVSISTAMLAAAYGGMRETFEVGIDAMRSTAYLCGLYVQLVLVLAAVFSLLNRIISRPRADERTGNKEPTGIS